MVLLQTSFNQGFSERSQLESLHKANIILKGMGVFVGL